MADDVKVKFGGDFSGVSKGATDAASQAGSALGTAIEGKVKAIGSSIAAAFAVGAIASKVWEGFKEGVAYMHDLNLAMSRTGQSSGEFQKLAYAGKEAGVSMDIVGRGLTEANKALEQAKNNQNQRNMFAALGMDAEKLKDGTYSATDALLALADQWDKFGNETKTRAGAMAVFGRFGEGMIPVIKQGRSALEEQMAGTGTYSSAEITGAAIIEKKFRAFERMKETRYRMVAAKEGERELIAEVRDIFSETEGGTGLIEEFDRGGGEAKLGPRSDWFAKKLAAHYKKQYGVNASELSTILGSTNFFEGIEGPNSYRFGLKEALGRVAEGEKPKAPTKPVEELAGALSASSLQAIGGGDVASVLSGTYQNDMVDLTRQIATNTTPKETAHDTPPPARAGK